MSGFDYCTIIGRDPKLWRWHVDNVLRNAGLDRSQWTFNVIIYYNENIDRAITDELIQICEDNDVVHHMHKENPSEPFIKRLYACWNKLYELGEYDLVLRGGSDQAWSPESFAILLDEYENCPFTPLVVNAQTVEAHGPSRHLIASLGNTPDSFDEQSFLDYCESVKKPGLYTAKQAIGLWGHPTPTIDGCYRTEGCSWLQSRELWRKHGPMPDYVMNGGITGDVWFHRRLQDAGVTDLLAGEAITYHLVRGESR